MTEPRQKSPQPQPFGSDVIVHPGRRLIYSRLFGRASRADLVARRRDALSQSEFDTSFDLIVDIRDADLTGLSAEDIGAVAAATTMKQTARVAYVADTDDKFGISRMYAAHRELSGYSGDANRVVRTLADALAWLGHAGFDPTTPSI